MLCDTLRLCVLVANGSHKGAKSHKEMLGGFCNRTEHRFQTAGFCLQ
jgi:hypothetical protein